MDLKVGTSGTAGMTPMGGAIPAVLPAPSPLTGRGLACACGGGLGRGRCLGVRRAAR